MSVVLLTGCGGKSSAEKAIELINSEQSQNFTTDNAEKLLGCLGDKVKVYGTLMVR